MYMFVLPCPVVVCLKIPLYLLKMVIRTCYCSIPKQCSLCDKYLALSYKFHVDLHFDLSQDQIMTINRLGLVFDCMADFNL